MTNEKRVAYLPVAALTIFLPLFLLVGCGEKKMEPVAVGELTDYRDPGIGFSLKHPKGWIVNAEVGRARMYNAAGVDEKFIDPAGVGPNGVEISIDVIKIADPTAKMVQLKNDMTSQGMVLGAEQSVAVGAASGSKVQYTANYGGKNIIRGHHVYVAGDSVLYDLSFSGFGDMYEAYAAVFDASLNSFQMPKPKVKGRDETLPSDVIAEGKTSMFTFTYPDNFNFTNPGKGKFEEVVELRGVRLDCSFRFDIFPAKGLTTEKVFDQNKGTYKSKSTGTTTIGGENARFLNYSSRGDVDSRAYFVVKNDKVIRISMNWFKPQASEYIPVYEQVINSIKFK